MSAALNSGLGTQGGAGGKSMGSQPQGPQMGFGMPAGGYGPNPMDGMQQQNFGDGMQQPQQGQMLPGPSMGMSGGIIQGTPPAGGFVSPFSAGGKGGFAQAPIAFGSNMGTDAGPGMNGINPFTGQTIAQPQPQGAYNQYTNAVFGGGNPAYQPNFAQQASPQDAYNQYTNAVFGGGNPAYQPNFAQPAGQPITNPPINRFAPPNAPGVRQQPRTAPQAGIPVQSARTVQPNRFTNTRTRSR